MIPSGWIIPFLIALPNIAWAVLPSPPVSGPRSGTLEPEPRILVFLERAGRVGVFGLPFFLNLHFSTATDRCCLGVAVLALGIYYLGWARYFVRGRLPELLYRPFAGIPVPLAISPITYFLACSGLTRSIALALVTLAFGAAHISLSVRRAGAT